MRQSYHGRWQEGCGRVSCVYIWASVEDVNSYDLGCSTQLNVIRVSYTCTHILAITTGSSPTDEAQVSSCWQLVVAHGIGEACAIIGQSEHSSRKLHTESSSLARTGRARA